MKKCLMKCFKSSNQKRPVGKEDKAVLKTEPEYEEIELKEGYTESTPLGSNSTRFLIGSLQKLYLFRTLSETDLSNFIHLFKHLTIEAGRDIVVQGDTGNFFYVLMTGSCKIYKNGNEIMTVKPGYSFGELALLTSSIRKSTVKSVSECTLYAIDKRNFKSLMKLVQERNEDSFNTLLNSSPFFSAMNLESKKKLFEISFLCKFLQGERLCNEGDESYFVYFLKSGIIDVVINKKIIATIEENRLFGELSLIKPEDNTRSANLVCKEDCEIYLIYIGGLVQILGQDYRRAVLKNIVSNCLLNEKLFKALPTNYIMQIVESFDFLNYESGSVALESGAELEDSAVVVCYGKILSMTKSFPSYTFIGLKNLNHQKVGTGKYRAEGFTVVGKVSIEKISNIIGYEGRNLISFLHKLSDLKKIRFLHHLEYNELQILSKTISKQEFSKGETIYSSEAFDENIYIVDQGSVGIYELETFNFRYDKNSVFGEGCVIEGVRRNSAKALTNVSCLVLNKEKIQNLLNDNMLSYIHTIHKISSSFELDKVRFSICLNQVKDRDLFLSLNISTELLMMAEVIYKKKIHNQDQFQLILNQKCVVSQIDHPHIPRFIRNLSDNKFIYFFYEFFDFIYTRDLTKSKLSEKASKFLFFNLISCLIYLHEKGILHRNICPENLWIDNLGYLKLTGFQYSKQCNRSYTVLDTQTAYKAKEVVLGKAYTKESEYWSAGVVLYELIHGKLPFEIEDEDGYNEIVAKIVNAKRLKFKKNVSNDCKNVLSGLLQGNPDKRIRIEDLVKCHWSRGISVDDIYHMNLKPVVVPAVSGKDKNRVFTDKIKVSRKLSTEDKMNTARFDWDDYF